MKKIIICLALMLSLLSGCASPNKEFVFEEYYSKDLNTTEILDRVIKRFNYEVSSYYSFFKDLEGNIKHSSLYFQYKNSTGCILVWNHPITNEIDFIRFSYQNDMYEVQGNPIILTHKNVLYSNSDKLEFPDYMKKENSEFSYTKSDGTEYFVKVQNDLVDYKREDLEDDQIKLSFYYKITNKIYNEEGKLSNIEYSYENPILLIDSNGLLKQINYNSYLDEQFTQLDNLNSSIQYYSDINSYNEKSLDKYLEVFKNSENKSFDQFIKELENAGFKFDIKI